MANDPKKDTRAMFDKLKKLRDEMTKKDNLQETGDFAADLIRKRTRLGFGVDSHGGSKKKLDKLSTGYINQRKKKKPQGPTTPSKSNLTRDGDMLDDLEAKVSTKTTTIGFSTKKSEDKAEWVSDKRPFNFLSKPELKQIKLFLNKIADKILKK